MKRVIIFDFDGTFYSGEHIFDNIEPKVRKNRRLFLPNLTDEEYSSLIQNYPDWERQYLGRDVVECIYKIKSENPSFNISIDDFWQWQEDNDYEIIINDDEVVNADFIMSICQKYPSYVVSNSSPSHLKRYMKRLNIDENWFKEVISNHFDEFDKTKKHYYYDIMKKEGVEPQNVLVVGDSNLSDLQPARLLNMKTLLIKSALELQPKLSEMLEKL